MAANEDKSTSESATPRRDLRFDSLDEICADARALLDQGYESVGQWNLAQVCGHITDWMTFPVEGFPKMGFPMNAMMWMMKITMGKRTLKKVLAERKMKAGLPTVKSTVPSSEADDAAAVADLERAVAALSDCQHEIHPSPFFGPMDRETAIQLQLVHCAHHLSFLRPKGPG